MRLTRTRYVPGAARRVRVPPSVPTPSATTLSLESRRAISAPLTGAPSMALSLTFSSLKLLWPCVLEVHTHAPRIEAYANARRLTPLFVVSHRDYGVPPDNG